MNLEALLLAHPDESLRSTGPDIFGNDLPTACGWGVVVDVLRERSRLFVDLNLKARSMKSDEAEGGLMTRLMYNYILLFY